MCDDVFGKRRGKSPSGPMRHVLNGTSVWELGDLAAVKLGWLECCCMGAKPEGTVTAEGGGDEPARRTSAGCYKAGTPIIQTHPVDWEGDWHGLPWTYQRVMFLKVSTPRSVYPT